MNTLLIQTATRFNEDGGLYYDIDFFIDEKRLIELVRNFESSFADDLAGDYANLYFGTYSTDYLLGKHPAFGENEDKTKLLGCICGGPGCWPLVTKISAEGNIVSWADFEQPHRHWSYKGFGPFYFDLQQYKNEIQKIPRT